MEGRGGKADLRGGGGGEGDTCRGRRSCRYREVLLVHKNEVLETVFVVYMYI